MYAVLFIMYMYAVQKQGTNAKNTKICVLNFNTKQSNEDTFLSLV